MMRRGRDTRLCWVERHTLAVVNRRRQARGVELLTALPRGIPICADECPLSRALGHPVMNAPQLLALGYSELDALALTVFIRQFDGFAYPHLIARHAERLHNKAHEFFLPV